MTPTAVEHHKCGMLCADREHREYPWRRKALGTYGLLVVFSPRHYSASIHIVREYPQVSMTPTGVEQE